MGRDRRRDHHRVDRRRRTAPRGTTSSSARRGSGRPHSASRSSRVSQISDDLRALELDEVAEQVRPPVPEPDDGDAQRSLTACPSAGAPAAGVCSSSTTSSPNDQLRAYSTSSSSASTNVECARAFTCHRPVMPAGTENRSKWCGANSSVSYGMQGRGPTSDISPRSTLKSCGSSSRLVLRRKRPTPRHRLAGARACRGRRAPEPRRRPSTAGRTRGARPSDVSARIVRNLSASNGRWLRPSRV